MVVCSCSNTGRAVYAAAPEVSAVPAVAHAEVTVAWHGAEVVTTGDIEAASVVHAPAVSAAVGHVEVRPSEVEVVTARVACVDAEVPVAGVPVERTVEVGGGAEGIPLPGVQDVAQVHVAALPVGSEDVAVTCDAHQVVQVDFVRGLILLVGEVQLVGHLVGEEQGLVAGLLVAHCTCRHRHGQHGYQGKHHLLHNRKYLIGLTSC